MHKFAGLDGHTSSCTLGVMNPKGKHLGCQVIETNGEALVNAVSNIPGKLHLCIEEGTQSSWLAEILSPHVEELVVVGVGQRRSKGPKSDKRDAFALADMLRNNDLESVVYKQVGPYSTLRQLVKVHAQIVQDVVRVKNRLRAIYRSRGVRADGTKQWARTNCKYWGGIKYCPAGKIASAFKVYYLRNGAGHDIGANGISLFCREVVKQLGGYRPRLRAPGGAPAAVTRRFVL